MIPSARPALVTSVGLLASAQAVWDYRRAFGSDPEIHVVSAGRPMTAEESAPLVPWACGGLDYKGTFYDGLSAQRISMVLPLLEGNDGTFQGMLEFLGVPYAGCGMTGVLLAHDPDHGRAVLDSLGLPFAPEGEGPSIAVAVLGNEDLVTCSFDPEAESVASRVYRGLGLGGWALIDVVQTPRGWCWRRVQVQPALGPGTPFLRLVEARGFDFASVLGQVLRWGQNRHDAEAGLKNTFKDRI